MKCYKHPEEEALYECNICGKPICGECMRFKDEEEDTLQGESVIICPDCTVESLMDDSLLDDDKSKKDKPMGFFEALSKMEAHKIINIKLFMLLVLLIGANIGFGSYLEARNKPLLLDNSMIQNSRNPVLEQSYILAALFRFAQEHEGRYPEKLTELYPAYINETEPKILGTKDDFGYVATKDTGFVLDLPSAKRFGYLKSWATKEGVIYVE